MEETKNNIIHWLKKKDSIFNILLMFVINPIIFSSFPIVWFLVFMNEKMIFSYDFFTNGMFGLSIFFLISIFLLILLGFLLVGSFTFFTIYINKVYINNTKNISTHDTLYLGIILFVINIVFSIIYYNNLKTPEQEDVFWYIIIFNSVAFIHIGMSYSAKGIYKLLSLVFFIIIFTWSTISFHTVLASFLETGLLKFRMGGEIKTEIIDSTKNKSIAIGKLILLTPNRVFLEDGNKTKIFNRNNIIIELSK